MPRQTELEFKTHFKEQIEFLTRSASAYDEGYESEAKRMAVVLRVLFHDTRNSTSLLTHLGKNDMLFYDTSEGLNPRNLLPESTLTITRIQFGGNGGGNYIAPLDEGPPSKYINGKVSFNSWWKKEVIKDNEGRKFTREDIVLLVCHKDGGAHVDENLDGRYADLTRNNSLGLKYFDNNTESDIDGVELASIRQITHEVLKSFKDEFNEYAQILDQHFQNLKSPLGQ